MLDYPPSYDAPTTFVEAVRAQNSAQVLHFTKSGTGSAPISFDVWQKRGSDVVNYRSYKGNAPFFYALKPVFVGPVTAAAPIETGGANPDTYEGTAEELKGKDNPSTKTGTWTGWDEPSNLTYTTVPGATATIVASEAGTRIVLKSYRQSTGTTGRADIYEYGDKVMATPVATYNFNCYGESESRAYFTVAEGLPSKRYKVIITHTGTSGGRVHIHLGYLSDGIRYPEAISVYGPGGAWKMSGDNLTYTEGLNAKCTVNETSVATKITFSGYKDYKGGRIKAGVYEVDGTTPIVEQILDSYSASAVVWSATLADNLPKKKYKVVLENLDAGRRLYVRLGYFIGELRVPQATRSYVTQEMPPTIPGNPLSPYNGIWDMGQYSNKDFAYFIRESGSASTEIVPTHSVLTEALASPLALWIDGTSKDLAAMYSNETLDASERIDVMQHIYGFHTDNPTRNLIEVWMTTSYLPDGAVEIRGRVKALQNIYFSGYPLMLPVPQRDGQCLFTSVGSQYQACEKPATASHDQYLDHAEGGKAFSYAYASTQLPNVIVALDVINPSVSLRPNAADRGGVLLNRRPASQLYVQKSYDEVFKDGTLAAGDEYAWSGRYIVGNIADPNRAMSRSVPGPRYPGFFVGPMPEPPADTMASTLPATQAFAKAGESIDISVAANGPWHVSVSGTGFSTSAVNGYGNGTVAVAASDNTGGSPRTGQVRLVCGTVLSTTTLTQE